MRCITFSQVDLIQLQLSKYMGKYSNKFKQKFSLNKNKNIKKFCAAHKPTCRFMYKVVYIISYYYLTISELTKISSLRMHADFLGKNK
jgi:hypothetical protein